MFSIKCPPQLEPVAVLARDKQTGKIELFFFRGAPPADNQLARLALLEEAVQRYREWIAANRPQELELDLEKAFDDAGVRFT